MIAFSESLDSACVRPEHVTYSRRYGGSGRYSRSDLLILGRPAVMVGALAVNAAINQRRKVAAQREAEVRWRDEHRVQVIATNYRLLCNTDQGWENYWYGDVNEFYLSNRAAIRSTSGRAVP